MYYSNYRLLHNPYYFDNALNNKIKKSLFEVFPSAPLNSLYEEVYNLLDNYPLLQKTDKEHIHLEIYYLLMLTRNIYPSNFPTHDLSFYAANIIASQKRAHTSQNLVVLDWEYLAIAILLTPLFDKIYFEEPNIHYPSEAAKNKLLEKIPECISSKIKFFEVSEKNNSLIIMDSESKSSPLVDSIVLGSPNFNKDLPVILKKSDFAHGILFTTWNFLNGKTHAENRLKYLESNIIQTVIQLQKPKRQSLVKYPALITLENYNITSPNEKREILFVDYKNVEIDYRDPSMINYEKEKPLPENSSTQLAFHEALRKSIEGESVALHTKQVMASYLSKKMEHNLSPSFYLGKNIEGEYNKVLQTEQGRESLQQFEPAKYKVRDFAQVLRCQIPRQRPTEEELKNKDLSIYYHEITNDDIDSITGFVHAHTANYISFTSSKKGNPNKYTIQKNDILLSYRGSSYNIGNVAFVNSLSSFDFGNGIVPAISGSSFCIIRTTELDPIWLYYHLQKKEVREFLLSKATGTSLLVVNTGDIGEIPFTDKDKDEKTKILEAHERIQHKFNQIVELQQVIREDIASIVIS